MERLLEYLSPLMEVLGHSRRYAIVRECYHDPFPSVLIFDPRHILLV
ncbi:MAG: hypothetical protein ABIN66_00330 [candidate division WOR-3 bacterium]